MTEKWIQYVLARYTHSPVCAWQQQLLIPNCQTAPVWWESDLLAVSRSGYCTEVEIKVTMADWKADAKKGRHEHPDCAALIKRFYYAGPLDLMSRFEDVWTRPGSGIIGVEDGKQSYPSIRVLREPVASKTARKLTLDETLKIARVAMVRYWMWASTSNDPEFKAEAYRDQLVKGMA